MPQGDTQILGFRLWIIPEPFVHSRKRIMGSGNEIGLSDVKLLPRPQALADRTTLYINNLQVLRCGVSAQRKTGCGD